MARTRVCKSGDAFLPFAVNEMASKSCAFFSATGNDGSCIDDGGLKKPPNVGMSKAFDVPNVETTSKQH